MAASVGLQYDLSATMFELSAAWVGGQFLVGDEGNEATLGNLDGYALLDASVERSLGTAVLYLRVSNLLDADNPAVLLRSGDGYQILTKADLIRAIAR